MVILIFGQPMILIYNFLILFLIRLGKSLSLIFFVFFLSTACSHHDTDEIEIIWKDNQAVSISVPKKYLNELPVDSIHSFFRVSLENENRVSILGDTRFEGDRLLFTSLIPFSRGLTYKIVYRNRQIGKIKIPPANPDDAPELAAIYPTQDTLPENLLKLYLQFSRPMREGESLKHIFLLNNQRDTIPDVFLDLRPELWNKERTVLTIWLDPGRIKRDLIPNQQMGNPLKNGERYTLGISSNWKDAQGLPLQKSYTRKFLVVSRDSASPDPEQWSLNLPPVGTTKPFIIDCHEPLDYFLLQETLQIIDEKGSSIAGSLTISNEETMISFVPEKQWLPGNYRLQVASYLEDLAGNNLDKVFDRDITKKQIMQETTNYEKRFVIK